MDTNILPYRSMVVYDPNREGGKEGLKKAPAETRARLEVILRKYL